MRPLSRAEIEMKTLTVFVLGAGASASFGFPLGSGWFREIRQELEDSSRPAAKLLHEQFGHDYEFLNRFRKDFFLSGKSSIDAFLEHRREYEKLGKAIIGFTLMRCENIDSIFQNDKHNWLRYIYNKLDTGFDEFRENAISFITFNYDRVIEAFLITALSNSYNKSTKDCVEVLESIPIIHLHGRLGYLPWESSFNTREFNNDVTKETLEACVNEIKIIYEDISDGRDAEFTRAKELLDEAERVYILGFGFHPTNVARLGLNNLKKKDKSLATGIGLTNTEMAGISQLTNGCVQTNNQYDCINFCRNTINWS
jgi:hypothetical protein